MVCTRYRCGRALIEVTANAYALLVSYETFNLLHILNATADTRPCFQHSGALRGQTELTEVLRAGRYHVVAPLIF